VNPLAEIAQVARAAGAIVVVDAVASLGADPLEIDDWGLDLTVLATQKALSGPTGASAAVVSPRAWEWLESNPAAPRNSALSLLDWKKRWIDPGRRTLPVIPHHVETRLLGAAVDHALEEGLAGVIARHAAARNACRRGLAVLALEPWIRLDSEATAVATTFRSPAGIAPAELLDAARLSHLGASALPLALAPEPLAAKALRVTHTGWHATLIDVVAVLSAVGLGLRRLGLQADVGGAIEAALVQAAPSSAATS
jgi:aspartate aminotransferase-like enzyme